MSAPSAQQPTDAEAGGGGGWTMIIAVLGVVAVWLLAFTASDPLFLAPFREAQTAISADWLLREPSGGMLAYQTPVLGVPWRVPLEFPLFQQIAAGVAGIGVPIVQSGRLVSLICWLGCLAVLAKLLPLWGLPRPWLPAALALTAVAPLHSAYSTAYLIESMALLAALIHLWSFWRCAGGAGPIWWFVALLSGVAVALIKITTWVAPAAATGMLTLKLLLDVRRSPRPLRTLLQCAGLAAMGLTSLVSGLLWSKWAASVRDLNPMARFIFSKDEQLSWIFGSLHDHLSLKLNAVLAVKHLLLVFGPMGIVVPLILIRALFWPGAGRRLRASVIVPLGTYLVHALLLFPLHLRHDYYLLGSGVFLSATVVAAVAVIQVGRPDVTWVRWMAPALAVSMALGGLVHVALRRGYRDLAVDAAIRALGSVKEPGALLTFGFDWSSKIPFTVGRKALMGPDTEPTGPGIARFESALSLSQSTPFAAAIVMVPGWSDGAASAAARLGLDPQRRYPFWEGAFLLVRTNAQPTLSLNPELNTELTELALRTSRVQGGSGLVFARWPGSGRPGNGFEIVVRRAQDAFWVQSDGLQLVRARGYFKGN